MKWQRLGHVFVADGQHDWMATHAALPFPLHVQGDIFRIFFTCRNTRQRSHAASLTFDLAKRAVLDVAQAPLLAPGAPGYFDDAGVMLAQLVAHDGGYYAYYMGWSLRVSVPFQNSIGLATCTGSLDDWRKHADVPLLDRSAEDPLSLSYPWVLKEPQGWRMWYGSHLAWESDGKDMLHAIKYAESDDGLHWRRTGTVAITLLPEESGLSRPCVIKDADAYHIWYSRRIGRKETYLLGYATSPDGISWQRRDAEAGLEVSSSATDWDAEMVCYPCVFDHNGARYMLYNGNGFGRSGFGLAIME